VLDHVTSAAKFIVAEIHSKVESFCQKNMLGATTQQFTKENLKPGLNLY
jgi:hypothetical protein